MKKIICKLIGHVPRGPINDSNCNFSKLVLYRCYRCGEKIYFDVEKGWLIW